MNILHNFFLLTLFLFGLSACGKDPSKQQISSIDDTNIYYGAMYGTGKRCGLTEASDFDNAYRHYLMATLGVKNFTTHAKIVRAYEIYSDAAAKQNKETDCNSVREHLIKMTSLLNKETD